MYATRDLIPHELRLLYKGVVKTVAEYELMVAENPHREMELQYTYDLPGYEAREADDSITIDASCVRNCAALINDPRNRVPEVSANVVFVACYLDRRPAVLVDNPGILRAGDQLLVDYGDEFWKSFAHIKVRSKAFQEAVEREMGRRLIVDAVKAHRRKGRRERDEIIATQCRPFFTKDAASYSHDDAAPIVRRNPDPPPPRRRSHATTK